MSKRKSGAMASSSEEPTIDVKKRKRNDVRAFPLTHFVSHFEPFKIMRVATMPRQRLRAHRATVTNAQAIDKWGAASTTIKQMRSPLMPRSARCACSTATFFLLSAR